MTLNLGAYGLSSDPDSGSSLVYNSGLLHSLVFTLLQVGELQELWEDSGLVCVLFYFIFEPTVLGI